MRNVRVWIDNLRIQTFPKLQSNVSVDVVVVGAGITRIIVACFFEKGWINDRTEARTGAACLPFEYWFSFTQ
jgi:hypothetical protein